MGLLDDQELAVRVKERSGFRINHVGTKLNEQELRDLESLVRKRGTSQGELIRQLILRELRQDAGNTTVSVELTETIGLRLMLTNVLKPIATGQKITPEVFDAIMAEVRKTKREVAVEAQRLQESL
jgi:Ribbon-helix-helix protein, copG family